jgi:hypothetical protein
MDPDTPCPNPGLAVSFTRIVQSYVTLADVLEAEAKNSNGVDWPALDHELVGLHANLAETVAMLSDLTGA